LVIFFAGLVVVVVFVSGAGGDASFAAVLSDCLGGVCGGGIVGVCDDDCDDCVGCGDSVASDDDESGQTKLLSLRLDNVCDLLLS
jgi:hypothetical protein